MRDPECIWYAKPGRITRWSLWYRVSGTRVECRSEDDDWGPSVHFSSATLLRASALPRVAKYPDTQPIDLDLLVDIGL